MGFDSVEFIVKGDCESILVEMVVLLDILCKDKRGGRPDNLGGTGVAPCKCALRSAAFTWCSRDGLEQSLPEWPSKPSSI
mmetsp:Transcript_23645/g.25234  ORF Transcript_23645/g.25234 Transcript_23645/m.25234 type:complete len:80 (-) Transcript_23645:150-389(-)